MTVDTTYTPAEYTGDGSTTAFALSHLVYESSHILVTVDGVTDAAWSATGYGLGAGVTVTMDTAPASGTSVIVQRIVPYTQDTDLENFDGNPADVTEKQFDLLAMAAQQIAESTSRTITTSIGTTITSNEIAGTITASPQVLTITTAGPAASSLGSISSTIDTTFTSLADGDFFQYNGTNWVNIASIPIASLPLASQAEAEAGTDETKIMNPLRTAEAIAALVPDSLGSIINVQGFSAGGTYTRTAGVTKAIIILAGATGGGSANSTNNGTAGGSTAFGSFVSCTGGSGGTLKTVDNALTPAASGSATGELAAIGNRTGGAGASGYDGGGQWRLSQAGGDAPVVIDYVTVGATETVTIGAAGAGGAAGVEAGESGLQGYITVIELS